MAALLGGIARFERWASLLAFALMALSLMADVISRRIFMTGLIGATEVAVIGMVAVAMFGVGVATDHGAHLRPRLFDALIPKALEPAMVRLSSAVTAAFFAVFAGLSGWMVWESVVLGDRTEILRLPIWTLQAMIFIAFATNMIRFAVYAGRPELRPSENLEDVVEREDEVERDDGDPA
ncbi:MAG: TRAP transporter small permease [Alphaproteobacteria bacterium]|nr:TRAP transporter small permease [Alphaproteobacteria bacterium]